MKGTSPSTKGKASRGHVKAGSRRRPFQTRVRWEQQVRRSHVGAKLATYSSSDGSPERAVKVVVVSGDVGGGGDGSRFGIPVFGGGDRILTSSDKIGESGLSSASIANMGAGGGKPNEPQKLGACGGGRLKEGMKTGGCEDEGTNMEAGLYAPDSEEEHGGNCGRRRQVCPCPRLAAARARLAAARAQAAAARGRAAVPDVVADPAPEVATDVNVPAGAATAPDELLPEVKDGIFMWIICNKRMANIVTWYTKLMVMVVHCQPHIRMDTKVVSTPNLNFSQYIFPWTTILFMLMFFRIVVQIWHFLSSLLW